MYSIITGSLILSLLHAVIPNHWLPVLAIGKKDNWSLQEITRVTFISGLAHALSTIAIGIILGLLGLQLANTVEYFTHFIAPVFLILIGLFSFTNTTTIGIFIYKRYLSPQCLKIKSLLVWS